MLFFLQVTTDRTVTLHVSVWVEIYFSTPKSQPTQSRSTWACELKYFLVICEGDCIESRSTWACELKYWRWQWRYEQNKSRSTWACELKFISLLPFNGSIVSRSTWACELKLATTQWQCLISRHAPRERVSWNLINLIFLSMIQSHAPRERVSWNLWGKTPWTVLLSHAPRERVSWNNKLIRPVNGRKVTLHVSVWVEMILPMAYLRKSLSRSTWACELKFEMKDTEEEGAESRSTWACEL